MVQTNQPIAEMREGIPLNYEHRILRADGSVRWVRESAGVVYDDHSRPARIIGFVMDITDIKTDSLRLRQILVNLVGNALKFTSTGQETVHCYKAPSAAPAHVHELTSVESKTDGFVKSRKLKITHLCYQ